MTVVQLIALVLFALGGLLPFFPNVDIKAAFVCLALGGVLLSLEAGGVIDS